MIPGWALALGRVARHAFPTETRDEPTGAEAFEVLGNLLLKPLDRQEGLVQRVEKRPATATPWIR